MIKTETSNNSNTEVLTINGNEQSEFISSLFEGAKAIYKCAENNGCTDSASEQELLRIQSEFRNCGNKKGVLFCQKALSIIYEKRGDAATEIIEKTSHYEAAHTSINNAVTQALQMKWEQPSLLKRQAIIKSKLGDALHQSADHYNANILESDAFKIFGKMLNENPSYAEAHLETATASLSKMKWSLRKMLCELSKAENLFNNPKHTKHLPEVDELKCYQQRIDDMRSTINLLLVITH